MIVRGTVERVEHGIVVAHLPGASAGAAARIAGTTTGVVRAVRGSSATLAVHSAVDGIACGAEVLLDPSAAVMPLGTCVLGRAIDARGAPLDGGPPLRGCARTVAIAAVRERAPVVRPFWTGVRVVDGLLTFGCGARMGIFGAPGSGKSTLLESIAAGDADAVVVALVGERGREAEQWMRRIDERTTIVCATSDRSAAERWRAAHVAFAQARALCDRGLHVLLLFDSIARTAGALRELALAAGEPAGRGGFPASVFADLARLMEAAGATHRGTVTLVATVLDDGDERDPVSDAARSLLDGHIALSTALVRAGRFPAIDVPASASRTMPAVVAGSHAAAAAAVREAIAALARTQDARELGVAAHSARLDAAVACEAELEAFLRQDGAAADPAETRSRLEALAARLRALGNAAATPR